MKEIRAYEDCITVFDDEKIVAILIDNINSVKLFYNIDAYNEVKVAIGLSVKEFVYNNLVIGIVMYKDDV